MGIGGAVPLALDDPLDLEGTDFGITRKQSLTGGRVEVVVNFSAPPEVETVPGSRVFEFVTQKVVTLGETVKNKHYGDNLKVTPEYRLVDARHANLTESVSSLVLPLKLLNF